MTYNGLGEKDVSGTQLKPTIWQYTAQGYWMIPMNSKTQYPYVKVGLGAYSFNPDIPGEDTKTKFGLNGGLGWNKMLPNGKTSFGIDAAYHWLSTGSDYKTAGGDNALVSFVTLGAHVGWGIGKM